MEQAADVRWEQLKEGGTFGGLRARDKGSLTPNGPLDEKCQNLGIKVCTTFGRQPGVSYNYHTYIRPSFDGEIAHTVTTYGVLRQTAQ